MHKRHSFEHQRRRGRYVSRAAMLYPDLCAFYTAAGGHSVVVVSHHGWRYGHRIVFKVKKLERENIALC